MRKIALTLLFIFAFLPALSASTEEEWGFTSSKGTWLDNPEQIAKAHSLDQRNNVKGYFGFLIFMAIAGGVFWWIRRKAEDNPIE